LPVTGLDIAEKSVYTDISVKPKDLKGDLMLEDVKCCRVDAVVAVDARGQVVLPKEVREKAEIKAGDKFVVISNESEGKVCCIFLVKAEYFNQSVKGVLGPMVRDLL
jgi:antitoxin PrlF